MQWSRLFIPTLRESPADTGIAGQRLLARAGYARGDYLFLGQRVMARIAGLVRDEFDPAGAQEVALGHDEAVAAARELRSYRQLPQLWYRVEGDQAEAWWFGLDKGLLPELCANVCQRLELPLTHELLVESEAGESALIRCPNCGPRAPAAPSAPLVADPEGDLTPEAFHTPGRKTIANVADFTGLPATSQMKSLVLVAAGELVLALVRGDHQLDETRLAKVLDVDSVYPAEPEEIRARFGASAGSLGPIGVAGVRIVADEALRGRRNMICGANKDDYHLRHVTPGEDFQPEFFDLRRVEPGDACHQCGAMLEFRKAIEIGSVRSFRHPDLHVTGDAGAELSVRVSHCRIDFTSILRAAIELWHDKDGIVLPAVMAPFDVVITPVNIQDASQREVARSLEAACAGAGLDALFDDRDERPGVKFKDADLIGVPWRITVGRKLAQGIVEIVERRTRTARDIAAGEATVFLESQVHP